MILPFSFKVPNTISSIPPIAILVSTVNCGAVTKLLLSLTVNCFPSVSAPALFIFCATVEPLNMNVLAAGGS